jgi:glycosyltransferase involved in cell wall biosynthesis
MPKLLIASTVPSTIEAFLLPFARHFRQAGWTVDAAACEISVSTCAREFDHVFDIGWSRNLLAPSNFSTAICHVASVLARGEYDIIHTHTAIASLLLRIAASRMPSERRPVIIYTSHGFHFYDGGNPIRNTCFRTLERIAGRWTDFLVTINREDELAGIRIAPNARVVYMPGIGVDTNHFVPNCVDQTEVAAARADLGIPADAPVAIMIAEFIGRKRPQDLLRALVTMRRRDLHVVLAGAGPLAAATRTLAASLGLADRVHFLGFQKELRKFLLMSCCAVLCSSMEGLPRSVMESLACGIPVVGSDVRGTRDLLQNGTGLLFPVGDVDKLAHLLDWILDHPELARRMGTAGRETISRYDEQHIIACHDRLYAEALHTRHRNWATTEPVEPRVA